MIDVEQFIADGLDEFTPTPSGLPDWDDVRRRARVSHQTDFALGTASSGDPIVRVRRPLYRRPRVMVLALLLVVVALFATPAFGVQRLVLDLLGRKNVSFNHSASAPNNVKKEFLDLSVGGPAGLAPNAIAGQTRLAAIVTISGHRRRLWVAPTRGGGYCYQFEVSILGCRQNTADREVGKRGQFGVSYAITNPGTAGYPIVSRITGDLTNPSAASITIQYVDGTSHDVPFVWVSRPIAAGFFTYDIPVAHWNTAHRVTSVTVRDSRGRRLAVQTVPYQRPIHRAPRPSLAIKTPRQTTLPTRPTPPPSKPVQRGTADGFTVIAGRNGSIQFTEVAETPTLRKLRGHSAGFDCFQLSREFGIFTMHETGRSGRFAASVGTRPTGIRGPFDGCEIQGSAGHLWPDTLGSHSAVEIPLTSAGRAFFADRAAARDLALFVRSRRVHAIRHEPPAKALADLKAAYGQAFAKSRIRIAIRADELVFSEASPTGRTFSVTVRAGRVVHQNLRPYAFVF